MLTVNKFMCQVELFVGCIIIGMLNIVFSAIFFVYSVLDIFYHNLDRDGEGRRKRAAVLRGNRRDDGVFDLFVVFKAFIFVIYFLHFVYCFFLIAAAFKKSTKYVKRYLIASTLATLAAFSEGFFITFNTGITDMALNYFAFSFWNVYFLICVYSYYDRYKERASFDGSDAYEAEAIRV